MPATGYLNREEQGDMRLAGASQGYEAHLECTCAGKSRAQEAGLFSIPSYGKENECT